MEGITLQSKHNRRSKTKLLCKKTFKTKVRVTTKKKKQKATKKKENKTKRSKTKQCRYKRN
jgi:hypothetical protein